MSRSSAHVANTDQVLVFNPDDATVYLGSVVEAPLMPDHLPLLIAGSLVAAPLMPDHLPLLIAVLKKMIRYDLFQHQTENADIVFRYLNLASPETQYQVAVVFFLEISVRGRGRLDSRLIDLLSRIANEGFQRFYPSVRSTLGPIGNDHFINEFLANPNNSLLLPAIRKAVFKVLVQNRDLFFVDWTDPIFPRQNYSPDRVHPNIEMECFESIVDVLHPNRAHQQHEANNDDYALLVDNSDDSLPLRLATASPDRLFNIYEAFCTFLLHSGRHQLVDWTHPIFLNQMHREAKIIDRREIKGQYGDLLALRNRKKIILVSIVLTLGICLCFYDGSAAQKAIASYFGITTLLTLLQCCVNPALQNERGNSAFQNSITKYYNRVMMSLFISMLITCQIPHENMNVKQAACYGGIIIGFLLAYELRFRLSFESVTNFKLASSNPCKRVFYSFLKDLIATGFFVGFSYYASRTWLNAAPADVASSVHEAIKILAMIFGSICFLKSLRNYREPLLLIDRAYCTTFSWDKKETPFLFNVARLCANLVQRGSNPSIFSRNYREDSLRKNVHGHREDFLEDLALQKELFVSSPP